MDERAAPPVGFDPMLALERAAEAIVVTTTDLDRPGPAIVFVNTQFERMTGWSRAEIVGRSPRVLQGSRTDPAAFADLRRIAHGQPWEGRVVNYRKDGSEFDLEWSVTSLPGSGGAIAYYLSVQRDITERLALERAAFAAQRAKTDFLIAMSHELRTPLHAILGYGDLLLGDIDAVQRREYVEAVRAAAGALLGHVDAILAYSSGSGAVPEVSGRAELDLGEVVRQCVARLAAPAAAKGVRLAFARSRTALFRGDGGMLQAIFSNLIGNAVKFTPIGGRVDVRLTVGADSISFRVQDTGQGLPEGLPPSSGEAFWQADGGTARASVGLGLGLAIARRAAELHGGVLKVGAAPGGGTMALVRLPRRWPVVKHDDALTAAERRVRGNEARLARQEQIVSEMDRDGHPEAAEMARAVLGTFRRALAASRLHLETIKREQGG
ncbi:sensor histidine kinase [Paracraurococcus lichenis]|uniref:histidine kinase n=1 Tax=Paracraurococcus lichenis TaxID=3064888 RepID=A0ABT9E8J0_9PROT|nr:ATP-binding protein [Paracraurococcus sp. LOR1-02]MDO9712521.1 ATP-binding protein [Paracraurococcus sp. LOR1-02]